jgi:hypothetical protein
VANIGDIEIKIGYAEPVSALFPEDAPKDRQLVGINTLLKLSVRERIKLLWSGRLWISLGMVPDLRFVGAWQTTKINIVPRSWKNEPVTSDGKNQAMPEEIS